jgi:hypothetical protein
VSRTDAPGALGSDAGCAFSELSGVARRVGWQTLLNLAAGPGGNQRTAARIWQLLLESSQATPAVPLLLATLEGPGRRDPALVAAVAAFLHTATVCPSDAPDADTADDASADAEPSERFRSLVSGDAPHDATAGVLQSLFSLLRGADQAAAPSAAAAEADAAQCMSDPQWCRGHPAAQWCQMLARRVWNRGLLQQALANLASKTVAGVPFVALLPTVTTDGSADSVDNIVPCSPSHVWFLACLESSGALEEESLTDDAVAAGVAALVAQTRDWARDLLKRMPSQTIAATADDAAQDSARRMVAVRGVTSALSLLCHCAADAMVALADRRDRQQERQTVGLAIVDEHLARSFVAAASALLFACTPPANVATRSDVQRWYPDAESAVDASGPADASAEAGSEPLVAPVVAAPWVRSLRDSQCQGLRTALTRLLALAADSSAAVSDAFAAPMFDPTLLVGAGEDMRSQLPPPSAVAALLSQCRLDQFEPTVREWGLMGVRNACLVSEATRQAIQALKAQQVVAAPELGPMGVTTGQTIAEKLKSRGD